MCPSDVEQFVRVWMHLPTRSPRWAVDPPSEHRVSVELPDLKILSEKEDLLGLPRHRFDSTRPDGTARRARPPPAPNAGSGSYLPVAPMTPRDEVLRSIGVARVRDAGRMSGTVRAFGDQDLPWAESLSGAQFGGRLQARLGSVVDALACPGLVAEINGDPVGIVTYLAQPPAVEIVYLEVTHRHVGIGTSLIEAVVARTSPRRLWAVTTNDNLDALRFYQRRGFRIVEVRLGAVEEARGQLKPEIPEIGSFGIQIRDEFVLERPPS
jgi:ribosomal protein S18 acetylase RimI-like enzyme